MCREVPSTAAMRALGVTGLAVSSGGFAMSVFSLVFLTQCAGLLNRCTVIFDWTTLASGLVLQGIGTVIAVVDERRRLAP